MSNIHLGRHDSARASSTALEGSERWLTTATYRANAVPPNVPGKLIRGYLFSHLFYPFKTKPKNPRVIQTKQCF